MEVFGAGTKYSQQGKLPVELVVSTVFHSKDDPQRKTSTCRTCEKYFDRWLRSLQSLDIHTLIIHDGLPRTLLDSIDSSLVTFIEVKLGSGSLNDERFRIYYSLITGQPLEVYPSFQLYPRSEPAALLGVGKLFFTDAADVVFLKNPFDLVGSNESSVFVGSEDRKWIRWMHRKVIACGLKGYKFQRRQMYNAGILGGRIHVLVKFLHDFITLQNKLSNTAFVRNCNMPLFNAVVSKWSSVGAVKTGYPLHTSFLAFECNQSNAYICHK